MQERLPHSWKVNIYAGSCILDGCYDRLRTRGIYEIRGEKLRFREIVRFTPNAIVKVLDIISVHISNRRHQDLATESFTDYYGGLSAHVDRKSVV